jgi:hypothetical protein
VAAYTELNPVRAGLCADPKDYRYCGYAEALATGCPLARKAIRTILGQPETAAVPFRTEKWSTRAEPRQALG